MQVGKLSVCLYLFCIFTKMNGRKYLQNGLSLSISFWLLDLFFLPLFYVCDCFASVHVCVLHACLFQQRPEERSLLCVLGIEPRSSIEQQVLIPTAEPCFQPWLLEDFLFLCF